MEDGNRIFETSWAVAAGTAAENLAFFAKYKLHNSPRARGESTQAGRVRGRYVGGRIKQGRKGTEGRERRTQKVCGKCNCP